MIYRLQDTEEYLYICSISSEFRIRKFRRDKIQKQVGYFYCACDVIDSFRRHPHENQFKLLVIIGFTTGD
jgi:hypothetical protein